MTATTERHPFEDLLAQLTGAMRVRHGFGTQEDAQHTDVDRIVWIPGVIGLENAPFRLLNQDNPWRQACEFEVSIYGGSPFAVYGLHNNLVGWIDYLIGPPMGCAPSDDGSSPYRSGYRIAAGKVAVRGGDAGSKGWGTVSLVTLFIPVVRRIFPVAPITSVTIEVDAASPAATDHPSPPTVMVQQ